MWQTGCRPPVLHIVTHDLAPRTFRRSCSRPFLKAEDPALHNPDAGDRSSVLAPSARWAGSLLAFDEPPVAVDRQVLPRLLLARGPAHRELAHALRRADPEDMARVARRGEGAARRRVACLCRQALDLQDQPGPG